MIELLTQFHHLPVNDYSMIETRVEGIIQWCGCVRIDVRAHSLHRKFETFQNITEETWKLQPIEVI